MTLSERQKMKVTTKLVYTQGVEEEVFPSIDHNYGYVAPLRVSYMGFFRLALHRGEGGGAQSAHSLFL